MNKNSFLFIFLLILISIACQFPTPPTVTPTPILLTNNTLPVPITPSWTVPPAATDTPTLTFTPIITSTITLTLTPGVAMVSPSTPENVNCRFGPSVDYLTVGALVVGESVPILGKTADQSWWQINNAWDYGKQCWVSAAVTVTSGNLSTVPVKSAPGGLVTTASISAPATIHGFCGGPNPTSFEVSITTNGPATVTYHMAIYNGDGSLRHQTIDETRTFAAAATQTFDPGGVYKTDCGDYYAQVLVTSPNAVSDQVNWSVVEP